MCTLEKGTNRTNDVVLEFMDPQKNKEPGRLLYFDNFYTSIELIEILQPLGFRSAGTIRKNRKDLPKARVEEKLEVGKSRLLTKNDINLFVWKDKKKVIVLSNVYNVYCGQIMNKRRYDGIKWINIPKPFAIEEYNLRMIELTKTFHTTNITAKQYDTRKYFIT